MGYFLVYSKQYMGVIIVFRKKCIVMNIILITIFSASFLTVPSPHMQ